MEEQGPFTLDSVRESLIRQEDSLIFSFIERARFPLNSRAYDESILNIPGFSGSLVQYIVQGTETLHGKIGRYENPEENAFFPDKLSPPLVNFDRTQTVHPRAAMVNMSGHIWDMYMNKILPLFTSEGDDGDYISTAVCDLACLQALSRRIHFGKFVAEVKFKGMTSSYESAIRSADRDALMNLLTDECVEEMVLERIKKKASIIGQEVTTLRCTDETLLKCRIEPSLFVRLYKEWVIPLTKLVEVEYLLRRCNPTPV